MRWRGYILIEDWLLKQGSWAWKRWCDGALRVYAGARLRSQRVLMLARSIYETHSHDQRKLRGNRKKEKIKIDHLSTKHIQNPRASTPPLSRDSIEPSIHPLLNKDPSHHLAT